MLAPFAGRDTEAFFEHGVEKAEMVITDIVGNVDDFGIGIGQQLLRPFKSQFNLVRTERHAEFFPEQAAEMPRAAMKLSGEIGQGRDGKIDFSHAPDQLPETLGQFITVAGR